MPSEDYPLRSVCVAWHQKIERALKYKKVEFQRHANEAMRFFNGPQAFMWDDDYMRGAAGFLGKDERFEPPGFRMTVNRVSELVQLMAPKLYPRNPYRSVSPRKFPLLAPSAYGNPQDPYVQGLVQSIGQQEQFRVEQMANGAMCLEAALNYTPNELDLAGHCRRAIDECLIKGMGVLWTEVFQPHRMSRKLIGSFQDSCDNIVFDPDAEQYEEITWVARRRVHPTWEVEERFGLRPGKLLGKGQYESASSQGNAMGDRNSKYKRATGKEAHDLLEYWEIYSKQGFGDRLSGVKPSVADEISAFGDFCYIAVAENIPYPLNVSNELLLGEDVDAVYEATQWPIPFWADGRWPFTPLWFHGNPNSIYPLSHIKPAIGELRFLSWAMSFLASKIRSSCHTLVGVQKSAQEDIREQLFRSDGGYSIVALETATGRSLNEIIQVFDAPQINQDMWTIIASVNEQLDRRLGLSEMLYGGGGTQDRSATTTQTKQQNASIRMEDMFEKTKGALTYLARNEALAGRWCYTQEDLIPMIGPQCAAYWAQNLVPQNLETLVREYDFRIEAGNAREPSKETRVDQMAQSVQVLGPVLQGWMMHTGDVQPVNALIQAWGQANDINTAGFMLQPPAPPPVPPPAPGQHPAPGQPAAGPGPQAAQPPRNPGPPQQAQRQVPRRR